MTKIRQVPLTCNGHSRPVVDLCFSALQPDGSYFLVSAGKDREAQLRNGKTGDWIGTYPGHKGAVYSVRITPDASKVLTASSDYTARLYEAKTGRQLAVYEHQKVVRTADFLSNHTHFVTGGPDKVIRLFDIERPDAVREFQAHTGALRLLTGLPDPNRFMSTGEDLGFYVWDIRVPTPLLRVELPDVVTSIEMQADASMLLAYGTTVGQFSNFQMNQETTFKCAIESASMHPDGNHYAAGGADFYVHVVDRESGASTDLYKGHHGPIHAIRYSPDGRLFATGSEDGTIRLWQNKPGDVYGLWLGSARPEGDGDAAEGIAA